jgi:hypothetical protein
MYKLEIFSPEGVLLQAVPLEHGVHGIRGHANQLVMVDKGTTKVYQYEILTSH